MNIEVTKEELGYIVTALDVLHMEYMGCDEELDAVNWKPVLDLKERLSQLEG